MTNNGTPLLQMQNIKKDFFGNQVLEDINFTLGAGQVLGLCGDNGAMIGSQAYYEYLAGTRADSSLNAYANMAI